MTQQAEIQDAAMPDTRPLVKIHPPFVRITHWVNAIAVIIMIGSGWRIYNNVPIFEWLRFPEWMTLGGNPHLSYQTSKDGGFANALLWHFAAMWVFFINGTAALIYGFATGRLQKKWWPIRPAEVWHDFREALRFNLAHEDIRIYNAVQKLSYAGVIVATIAVFLSGLAIWKPVQFQTLTWLMYDFQGARLVHFLAMTAIVFFLIIHVSLAIFVPKTIVAMTKGSVRIKSAHQMPSLKAGE